MLARCRVSLGWQRALALACVLGIVSGAFLQAPRGCSVCPTGCPMHSARPKQPGCHHGGVERGHHPAPPATSDCTVRSTCGHVDHGVSATPAVLPSREPMLALGRVIAPQLATPHPPERFMPEPPTGPPKFLRA